MSNFGSPHRASSLQSNGRVLGTGSQPVSIAEARERQSAINAVACDIYKKKQQEKEREKLLKKKERLGLNKPPGCKLGTGEAFGLQNANALPLGSQLGKVDNDEALRRARVRQQEAYDKKTSQPK